MTDLKLIDYDGRTIRLTKERQLHILDHPEMSGQLDRIRGTLLQPVVVVATDHDESVYVYHRYYITTPVTSKYLLVVVKVFKDDAFVLTAFFSSRQKKGATIWQT
jgi:hypothetical protein